jgi:hypothetical protein
MGEWIPERGSPSCIDRSLRLRLEAVLWGHRLRRALAAVGRNVMQGCCSASTQQWIAPGHMELGQPWKELGDGSRGPEVSGA